jgi:hypothetical protein
VRRVLNRGKEDGCGSVPESEGRYYTKDDGIETCGMGHIYIPQWVA